VRKVKDVVKLLLVAEIEVESPGAAIAQARTRLDAFRESFLPSENCGVTLYCATWDDLTNELLNSQVEVTPFVEAAGTGDDGVTRRS
jgi:hypothetical protein